MKAGKKRRYHIGPTTAEYDGYASGAFLVQGLRAAGGHPTRSQLISALSGIKHYQMTSDYARLV
jgi:hypothetical protein